MTTKSGLLYFISFSRGGCSDHIIAFSLHREIYDRPPPQTYWYTRGTQLINDIEVSDTQLFGWCCIGSLADTSELVEQLKSGTNLLDENNKALKIAFPNKNLQPSPVGVNEIGKNYKFENYPPLSNEFRAESYSISNWEIEIGSFVSQCIDEKICDAISGYKSDLPKPPRPMKPLGVLGRGELFRRISSCVVFLYEPMGPESDFRGTGVKENKELTGYQGLVRGLSDNVDSATIKILTQNLLLLGETKVTPKGGWAEWELSVPKGAAPNGILQIVDVTDKILAAEQFHLLMKIDVKLDVVTAQVEDLYKRKLAFGDRKKSIDPPERILWQPSFQKQPVDLSEKLATVIASLAPQVLVHDPYGFGVFEKSKDGSWNLNESSTCFLNSLIVAMTKVEINEINFIIDPRRMKLSSVKLKKLIDNYGLLFSRFKPLSLKSVTVATASSPFHDRYLLGMLPSTSDQSRRLYKSTKSITGLLETNELEVDLDVSSSAHLKISQIMNRWDKAERRKVLG